MGIEEAREIVARGIALLDERTDIIPANWRDRIDVDSLDIMSGSDCVLGQLSDHVVDSDLEYHSWSGLALALIGSEAYGRDGEALYGFLSSREASSMDLTQAWREALAPATV